MRASLRGGGQTGSPVTAALRPVTQNQSSLSAATTKDDPSRGVLAVVVIYGRAAHQTLAWETLNAWLAEASDAGLALRHILVYDNSPTATSPSVAAPKGLTYQHDAENGGTRAACMHAVALARQKNCQWLLLLDQDTHLPINLKDAMTAAVREARGTPAAVVPRVWHGHQPISPATISMLGTIRPLPQDSLPPHGSRVTAIASGSLLNISYLEAMGPIPERLWLDGVDHWIFSGIYTRGGSVCLVEVPLQHNLSIVDIGSMPAWRLLSVLASERLLLDVLPWTARVAYPYRLLRHLLRISRDNRAAGRLAWQWALGRLDASHTRPPRDTRLP